MLLEPQPRRFVQRTLDVVPHELDEPRQDRGAGRRRRRNIVRGTGAVDEFQVASDGWLSALGSVAGLDNSIEGIARCLT